MFKNRTDMFLPNRVSHNLERLPRRIVRARLLHVASPVVSRKERRRTRSLTKLVMYRGKGTPRRKVKKTHKTAGTDDKKLQTALKKLNVQPIQGIEEVNMFKTDGNVIHFSAPKGTRCETRGDWSRRCWVCALRSPTLLHMQETPKSARANKTNAGFATADRPTAG